MLLAIVVPAALTCAVDDRERELRRRAAPPDWYRAKWTARRRGPERAPRPEAKPTMLIDLRLAGAATASPQVLSLYQCDIPGVPGRAAPALARPRPGRGPGR